MGHLPGEVIQGRFELVDKLGAGGVGEVWAARDRASGALVALKLLHAAGDSVARERLRREALAIGIVQHPGVRRVHEVFEAGGEELGLAMELCEGESLDALLAREGPLAEERALALLGSVTGALAAAHAHGIVHRDVKPGNIFVTRDGRGLILDFGLAKLKGRVGLASNLTKTGAAIGTPAFMAPEQLLADREIDQRVDVWALGVVLFEALAGRSPFTTASIASLLRSILFDPIPPLASVARAIDPALAALVDAMLVRDRKRRMSDLRPLLAHLLSRGAIRIDGLPAPHAALATATLAPSETAPGAAVTIAPTTPQAPSPAAPSGSGSDAGPTINSSEFDDIDAAPPTVRVESELELAPISRMSDHEVRVAGLVIAKLDHTGAADESVAWLLRSCARFGTPEAIDEQHFAVVVDRGATLVELATTALRCAAELVEAGWAERTWLGVLRVDKDSSREPLVARAPERLAAARARLADPRGAVERIALDDQAVAAFEPHLAVEHDASGAWISMDRLALPTGTGGGPFVGRDREMTQLVTLAEESRDERTAGAALVTGAPGAGKTRLSFELERRLSGLGFRCYRATADAFEAGSALACVAHLAGALCGATTSSSSAEIDRAITKLAASVGPALDARTLADFGALVRAPLGLEARLGDPTGTAEAMRRAFEEVVRALTTRTPTVLIVDDAQWADRASAALLARLQRTLSEAPITIVSLGRPLEEEDDSPARELAGPRALGLPLSPLSRAASLKLSRALLPPDAPATRVTEIAERAGGNPLFLEQLARTQASGDALPDSLLAVVQGRLDALEVEERRVLRAASVFGVAFTADLVDDLLDEPGATARAAPRLLELELLVPDDGGAPGRFRFCQRVVAEGAYQGLTEADRARGHRRAGARLAELAGADPAVIAEHFERGDRPDSALPFRLDAAERALASDDTALALSHAERALAILERREDPALEPVSGRLALVAAEALRWRGRFDRAAAYAARAARALRPGSRHGCVALYELAMSAERLADTPRFQQALRDLIATKPDPDAVESFAVGCAWLASSIALAADAELRRALFASAEKASRALDPVPANVRAYLERALGWDRQLAGDLESARRHLARAFPLHDEAGNRRSAAVDRANAGFMSIELGLLSDAIAMLEPAYATAERMDLDGLRVVTLHNLGLAVARAGRPALGRRHIERCLEMPGISMHHEVSCRIYRSEILLTEGLVEQALAEARAGRRRAELHPQHLPYATATEALATLAAGDAARAVTLAERPSNTPRRAAGCSTRARPSSASRGSARSWRRAIHGPRTRRATRWSGSTRGPRASARSRRDGRSTRSRRTRRRSRSGSSSGSDAYDTRNQAFLGRRGAVVSSRSRSSRASAVSMSGC
ncbi:MAG: protein kinase [Polyangiaceae bacterium]